MINYIKADLYRVLNKKSFYIFYSVIAVLYMLLIFAVFASMSAGSIGAFATSLSSLFPLAIGSFLFVTIYSDDLSAKTLPSVIGFGLRKIKIIFSKIILSFILAVVVFALGFLVYYAPPLILGFGFVNSFGVFVEFFIALLFTLFYIFVSSIVAFGLQRATIAITVYIVLAATVIEEVLVLLLQQDFIVNVFGELQTFTITGVLFRLYNSIQSLQLDFVPILQYLLYMVVAVVLSIVVLKRKDSEF